MKRRTALVLVLLGLAMSIAHPAVAGAFSNLLSGGKDAGAGVTFAQSGGPNVTTGESVNFTTENPWVADDQITLQPYANFSSSDDTEVRVDRFNGTWTNLSQLDVDGADLTVAVNDKQTVSVGGSATSLSYTEMDVDDSAVDFEYDATGATSLTVRDLPPDTEIAAVDTDSTSVLATGTTDSNGVGTFSGLPQSQHSVELHTNDGGPLVDRSSASPSDEKKLQKREVSLSVDVSDPDMPEDELSVDILLDGEQVDSQTVTSNQTVSTEVSLSEGGEHTWSVEVTDAYGETTTEQFSMLVPGTIYIRPETDPQGLINDSNVTITGRLYSGELIFEKSSEDGEINMTGLPVNRTYVLSVEADGYYRRTVIIGSLFDQDQVFLLNESKAAVYNEFRVNDLVGDFSGDNVRTRIFIEKGINQSQSVEWVTVSGDYVGANGMFESTLQKDRRYRIRISTDTGRSRILGSYTASLNTTVTLDIGEVRWNITEPETIRHSADFYNLTDEGDTKHGLVNWQFEDPNRETSELEVIIYEDGNESNEILNDTFSEGYGVLSVNHTIRGEQLHKSWVVEWTARNESGATIASGTDYATGTRYPLENPLGPKWTPVFLTTIFLFIGFIFGGRFASLGAIVMSGFAGVFWWYGWYAASGGVVVLAGIVGVAFMVGGGGRR